jgi:hypothetical protein
MLSDGVGSTALSSIKKISHEHASERWRGSFYAFTLVEHRQ